MKLKATKTLANYLQNNIKGVEIKKVEMTERSYMLNVDLEIFDHENDYNFETDTYNVIVVNYPYNYYSLSKYITTNDILKLYNKSNKTATDFIEQIKNFIEI